MNKATQSCIKYVCVLLWSKNNYVQYEIVTSFLTTLTSHAFTPLPHGFIINKAASPSDVVVLYEYILRYAMDLD